MLKLLGITSIWNPTFYIFFFKPHLYEISILMFLSFSLSLLHCHCFRPGELKYVEFFFIKSQTILEIQQNEFRFHAQLWLKLFFVLFTTPFQTRTFWSLKMQSIAKLFSIFFPRPFFTVHILKFENEEYSIAFFYTPIFHSCAHFKVC